MNHPGYFLDFIRQQKVFRCAGCKYDSFVEDNIRRHVNSSHKPVILPELEIPQHDWLATQVQTQNFSKTRIMFGFLTWNTDKASEFGLLQIKAEQDRLKWLGVQSRLAWIDNGSADNTLDLLKPFVNTQDFVRHCKDNEGISKARNLIIDAALGWNATHIVFIDGDIELIPFSSYAMLRYLSGSAPEVGCIGFNSQNCSTETDSLWIKECRKIPHEITFTDPLIAWTQYGMFRAEMFEEGLRFDENGPFGGPGWGFEDDDFFLQMVVSGYESRNTPYWRYLHRPRGSSLRNLGETLATKAFNERKSYLLDKWKGSTNELVRFRCNMISGMQMNKSMFTT